MDSKIGLIIIILAKNMNPIDIFISRLYRSTQQIDLEHFRHWALNELQGLIDFDAAVWSTGHLSTRTFHTHTTLGLPENFSDILIDALPINPISKALFSHAGEPVDMSDVLSDEAFYQSQIYKSVFRPNNIERILSSLHIDSRSGIYTLLTIYRNNREHVFSALEKEQYQRSLYHLLSAASQACTYGLNTTHERKIKHNAICDMHGVYHQVESDFLDLIEENFPDHTEQMLPFPVPDDKIIENNLCISAEKMGDLYRMSIRHSTPLDQLTERETEVVDGVTQGLSFKQIAKKLGLSPSTVSNHLYRVYKKLNIGNRSELADLISN